MTQEPKSPMAIIRPLTFGEKLALAAASLAIQGLPSDLQQASNAYDMQAMLVDPSSVGRGQYILCQAFHIFDSLFGFQLEAIDQDALHVATGEDCDKLIAEAIKAHEVENCGGRSFRRVARGQSVGGKVRR